VDEINLPFIVSVHIPKTAGTSFRRILETIYGDHLVIDHPWRKLRPLWAQRNPADFGRGYLHAALKDVRCIHGHFNAEKYSVLPNAGFDIQLVTWLRDPIERAVSAYYFLRDKPPPENPERCTPWEQKAKVLDIQSYFEETRHWCNTMSRQLAGVPISNFKFIGIVEEFDVSLQRFVRTFDLPPIGVMPFERKNPKKQAYEKYEVSSAVRQIIEKESSKDIELYRLAKDIISH